MFKGKENKIVDRNEGFITLVGIKKERNIVSLWAKFRVNNETGKEKKKLG